MTTLTDAEMERHLIYRAAYQDNPILAAHVEEPFFDDNYIAKKFQEARALVRESDGAPVKVRIANGKCLDVLRAMLLDANVMLELDHDIACLVRIGDTCSCRSQGSAWYRALWLGKSQSKH